MVLADLIARVLVLADAFLGFFVTVNATGGADLLSADWNNCAGASQITAYSGSLTACGSTIISAVLNLIPTLLALVQGVLPAVIVN